MKKTKIGILSLGCPRNLVDSENILGRLDQKGYKIVDVAEAEIAILNTCAFIEEAKKESIEAILDLVDLKKQGRIRKIVVYGCLSERYRSSLKELLPEVDAFVGRIELDGDDRCFRLTPRHFAYLKICEGCINNCSYCVIPKIKSKFVSLDPGSVLEKVRRFDRENVSELNIIGQDITGYGCGLGKGFDLAKLVKRIVRASSNIGWFRLLYLYPSRITDELLDVIKEEPRICKYIDVPVQHISGRILKLMNRKTSRNQVLGLLHKVRKLIPDVALRTSLIVGFPSETEKDFKELLEFVKEARFERLGVFVYSREEGTKAYDMKGQLPEKLKKERFDIIMSCQQKISEEINRGFLGRHIKVLIDEKDGQTFLGRSQYDAPEVDGIVHVNSKRQLYPGDFVDVRITDTLEYDLIGEIKDEHS